MLTEQIEALEKNLELLNVELEVINDDAKEVKKRIALTKAALKSLKGLEVKLADE